MPDAPSAAGWADALRPLVRAINDGAADVQRDAAWLIRGALLSAELIAGETPTEGVADAPPSPSEDPEGLGVWLARCAQRLADPPLTLADAMVAYRDVLEVRYLEVITGAGAPEEEDERTLLVGALLCIDELGRAVQDGPDA